MNSSKGQSLIAIGVGLIIIAIILLAFALSQPRVRVDSATHSLTAAHSDTIETTITYPLNLNTCTVEELMSISGVGESRAQAIVEYREYLGGYTSVEQIRDIKGIGGKAYNTIAPYVTV